MPSPSAQAAPATCAQPARPTCHRLAAAGADRVVVAGATRLAAATLLGLLATGCAALGTPEPTTPWYVELQPTAAGTPKPFNVGEPVTVIVLDGDTLMLPGERKARLLGINAPERDEPFDREAVEKLREIIGGRPVYVVYDVVETDRHDRDLVHLFLEDGTHVNREMVRLGFAQAYTIAPNVAYSDELAAAQREAQAERRGIWAQSATQIRITGFEPDPPGRDNENLNGEWVEITNRGEAEVSLAGATLSDDANTMYHFGDITLAPGQSVRVHTGSGTDTSRALFWGRRAPVWNNAGDTAFLRDPDGLLLDAWRIE